MYKPNNAIANTLKGALGERSKLLLEAQQRQDWRLPEQARSGGPNRNAEFLQNIRCVLHTLVVQTVSRIV